MRYDELTKPKLRPSAPAIFLLEVLIYPVEDTGVDLRGAREADT